MAKPFGKAQAHFIALGQAPERDIIATRTLFLGSLIGSLVCERHSGGILKRFEKRICGDKNERCEKQNGMQPSGSYCYHPASPLARFSTHTYHPAQARAFVISSHGDFGPNIMARNEVIGTSVPKSGIFRPFYRAVIFVTCRISFYCPAYILLSGPQVITITPSAEAQT